MSPTKTLLVGDESEDDDKVDLIPTKNTIKVKLVTSHHPPFIDGYDHGTVDPILRTIITLQNNNNNNNNISEE